MKAEIVYRRAAEYPGRHAGRSRPRAPGTASHRAIPGSRAVRRAGGTSPIRRAPCPQRHGARGRSLLGGDSYRGGQSVEWSFDRVSHDWMLRFLEHRIADRRMLALIRKWLKAGVLEGGIWTASEEGTPQGSSISPLLANIYLHYVFDLWAQNWRQRHGKGDVIIVRWADDFVVGFQHANEAERFTAALRERFQRFSLELHPEKTRLIRFGRFANRDCRSLGRSKAETFNFLGLTHSCSRNRNGTFQIRRTTMKKRLTAKLHEVKAELRKRMHHSVPDQGAWLRSVVQGYFMYHAVPGNWRALGAFRTQCTRLWYRSLGRRSHKSRVNWDRMTNIANTWLPKPRILHPWPEERCAAIFRGKSRVR